MKKATLLIFAVLIIGSSYSYTWVPFCPVTINANNICFGVGSWKGVICSSDGMYIWEDDIEEWSFYTYDLPIWEATYLNPTQILVTMGDGSWSDGIYTFDLESKQFSVVEWIPNPTFLKYHGISQTWYAGFQNLGPVFYGLYKSTDGLNWEEVSFFNEIPCACMDFYEEHLVISSISNIFDIYWSDDSGNTWNQSPAGVPVISDMKFNYEGELYGIFPNGSNSSGLWRSDDYGNSWEVEFWSDMMSAVGFDAMSTIFVGWEEPFAGNEGIAIYDPLAPPPGLTFINEGLPSLSINKILMNPTMSAIAIFCCTDSGVWMSYDYMVGEDETKINFQQITVYPNPAKDYINIQFNLPKIINYEISMEILDINGHLKEQKIANPNSDNFKVRWQLNNYPAGIYYCIVKNKGINSVNKFILVE